MFFERVRARACFRRWVTESVTASEKFLSIERDNYVDRPDRRALLTDCMYPTFREV